jgi:patatin-like phospholipase/acyl hydrolase
MLDNKDTMTYKDFRSWKPKFFHNFETGPINNDCSRYVVDVALYTSAAPTFFPIHHGHADGGLVANNPSMCALAQALEGFGGRLDLKDIRLLSIGTGMLPKYLDMEDRNNFNGNWGLKQWGPSLLTIMMDGVSGVADYQCKQLLRQNYFRLNMCFDKDVSLDSVDEIPYMSRLVVNNQSYKYNTQNMSNLQAARKWLTDVFMKDTIPAVR